MQPSSYSSLVVVAIVVIVLCVELTARIKDLSGL